MAEEILVKEPLTRELVQAGGKLMSALRSAGFKLDALFWLYQPELNRWRLIVASPQVDTDGPTATYATIREILSSHPGESPELGPFDISVLGSQHKLIRTLAGVNKSVDLTNKRWSDVYLNDEHIDDMYVYFISEDVEPLPGSSWYI